MLNFGPVPGKRMNTSPSTQRRRFGPFEVDLRSGELRRHGVRIKLQEQPFQVLIMLLDHPGEVVTREELRQRLWPADTFVDFEVGLNAAVKRLRDALGDSADTPRYIETLPRRGYRLIIPVESAPPSDTGKKAARSLRLSLRTGWLIAALLVLAGVPAGYWMWQRQAAGPNESRVMVAVLPFQNLTGDPAQDYFADGFTEEMIGWLGQYQPDHLGVIARTSAMRFKGTSKSVAEIGQELGVDYVLEGSVRREAERVRIAAQLIRVKDQTHVWSQTYDRELRRILSLQTEVAGDIAREIRFRLAPRTGTQARTPQAIDPQAYEAYIRGLFFWHRRDKQSLEKAMEFFEEALRREPTFAMASIGLARSCTVYAGLGYGPTAEGAAKAEKAALHALELQPDLGEAYAVLAWVRLTRWDWAEAEKMYQRALQLNPNDAIAHLWYGHYLLRVGRLQESLEQRQRAYELDPLDTTVDRVSGCESIPRGA
jgi:TolB-like protein/DNA-binding winged helix-turn-helix (wHTH) protein